MSPESPRLSIEVSAHAGREISKLPHAIARLILEEIRARLTALTLFVRSKRGSNASPDSHHRSIA